MANSNFEAARNRLYETAGLCPLMDMDAFYAVEAAFDAVTDGVYEGRRFLGNAFSLQMVPSGTICTVEEVPPEEVPSEAVSIIGHLDTANVVSSLLGRPVACNRTSIELGDGDVLYVAQLMGGRLPEGATTLPEGFRISFRKVTIRC